MSLSSHLHLEKPPSIRGGRLTLIRRIETEISREEDGRIGSIGSIREVVEKLRKEARRYQ
jgi:hypothetical protein